MPIRILIVDHVGLAIDDEGCPDFSAVKAHVESKGAKFIAMGKAQSGTDIELHFHYLPDLSEPGEIKSLTECGQYDAVIAAATFIPQDAEFAQGGVRIGTGTGNMGSSSWGGPNGGGAAPLMNTPGFNARATAQMTFRALLHFRPSLIFTDLHARVVAGTFDTGRDLRTVPTAKLEGQTMAILGYGNIGKEVAKLAKAFGIHVKVYARPHHHERIRTDGFQPCATALEAASQSDVLSVHMGLGALDSATGKFANQNFIADEILQSLRPGATLLNFDRGECVDALALQRAMQQGHVAHAAIDADIFLNAEGKAFGPMAPYMPLANQFGSRLLLLPHAAADTDHPSRVAGAKQAVDQIFDAIVHKRVVNAKGQVPPGYTNGGAKLGV